MYSLPKANQPQVAGGFGWNVIKGSACDRARIRFFGRFMELATLKTLGFPKKVCTAGNGCLMCGKADSNSPKLSPVTPFKPDSDAVSHDF